MSGLRALVVDDDATYRRILDHSLRRIGVAEVAVASELSLARSRLEREAVDVVTIDVVLRGESGLDLLKWLRDHRPNVTAVLVTSGSESQACSAVDGLLLGASALIIKPTGPNASAELDAALAEAISVRTRPTTSQIPKPLTARLPKVSIESHAAPREIIALGASTGGPPAILQFLGAIPAKFRTPILITQHMPTSHVPHFAALLRERSGLAVAVAEDGETVLAGRIYVAPGGCHLRLVRHGDRLILLHDHGPEEHYCRPAVDPMFRSVAAACGAATIGVVLTGMGSDGALGAIALRERGAPVLVQDKASSVVWGMPGAVVSKGAADLVAPVAELARQVGLLDSNQNSTWRIS